MRVSFRQFRKAEEGQALVFVALGLTALMLMAGLGVDIGYLHYQKEQMQKAADAAALAGAAALLYNGNFNAAALNDSAANGFTNLNNGVVVTVNHPPLTSGDPYQHDPDAVEVIVAQTRPTFFMQVIGFGTVHVAARAIASRTGDSSGCMFALDPTSSGTFLVDGAVNLTSTCGIYVNSQSLTALRSDGGSVTVSGTLAQGIGVVGDYSGSGFSPTPTMGIPPFADPLANVPAPPVMAGCQYLGALIHHATLSAPATICGTITLLTGDSVTFGPGNYTLKGGLTMAPGATVRGSGVTFYVTEDRFLFPYTGIHMRGNPTTNLAAPMTGAQSGILFFQDRSLPTTYPSSSFDGSNGATFTGSWYFPTTTVRYKGTPGLAASSIIVGWQLEFQGNSGIRDSGLGVGSPAQSAILVE